MLKKLCFLGAPTMVKVVGKKLYKKTLASPHLIAKHFKLNIKQNDDDEDISKKYLIQVFQKRQTVDKYLKQMQITQFMKIQNELNILSFTKEKISSIFKRLTPQAQNVIDNYFALCLQIFFQFFRQTLKTSNLSKAQQDILNQVCQTINQFFPLATKSSQNCLKYLNMVSLSFKNSFLTLNRYSFNTNIKICTDQIMQMPKNTFNVGQIVDILKNLNGVGIRIVYYEKDYLIFKHFYLRIKQLWPKKRYYQNKVFQIFSRLQCYSSQMLDKAQQILFQFQKENHIESKQLQIILLFLVKFKRINNKNYKQYSKIIGNLIHKMAKNQQNQFYLFTFTHFYYARIWIPQYWGKVFEQLPQQSLKNNIFYSCFVISRLFEVDKQNIPENIIRQSGKKLKKIIQKRPNFAQNQIHRDFNLKQNNYQSLGCQTQIANSLRLLNLGIVRVQQMVDIFMVDIMINNQFVIEVNGSTHYIYNLDSEVEIKQHNIKTQFRTWFLQRLGYKVIDIDLEVYNQGSFLITSSLYQIYNNYSGKNDVTSFCLPPRGTN